MYIIANNIGKCDLSRVFGPVMMDTNSRILHVSTIGMKPIY